MSTKTANESSWRGFTTASLPEVPHWVETVGRFGYMAKGLVYFIIGFLAFKLAIGAGGDMSGAKDAIREIGQQPYGRILLGVTAIGLFSYTLWRWVEAVKDTEGAGTDMKGVVQRTGYAISGLSYALLGVFAGSLALGMAGGRDNSDGASTSFLLDSTLGRVVLGAIGAVVIGTGLFFMYRGYTAKFMVKYHLAQMSENLRKTAYYIGRMGLITHGIAMAIIGWFLLSSAYRGTDDGQVSGMSGALAAIAAQPYGKILLGVAGVGLMAYAIHMFLMGRYRRFNVAS